MKGRLSRWLGLALTLLIIGTFAYTIDRMQNRLETEAAQRIEEALKNAALECYAIEGRYPDSADYLIEHYGIIVDTGEYHIFYEVFASNVMPDIRVYRKE